LPAIFKKVNEKTMVQEFALTFFVAVAIFSMFLLGTFEKIINYIMFIDSLSLVSAAGAVFVLRHREKVNTAAGIAPETAYKMKFFPIVPLLFMFFLLMVTINVVISDPLAALYGFSIFLVGYPLYRFMRSAVAG